MRNQNRRKVFYNMMNMENMINCAAKIGYSFRRISNLPIYFNEKYTAKITFVKIYITQNISIQFNEFLLANVKSAIEPKFACKFRPSIKNSN